MPENGVEIVGGLAQSSDPEMYKLPPVADWAIQAVPGENGGESPVLYSVALADLSVRQALIAVGDALVPANNGNGKVTKALDLTRLSPEQIEEAMEGAEKIRGQKDLPAEVRQPVLDFMKAAKNGNTDQKDASKNISSNQSNKARRRALKREEENRRREQLQNEHDAQRQSEFERLEEWQEENPPLGSNHFALMMPLLKTTVNTSGEFVVVHNAEVTERTAGLQDFMVQNPDKIADEIKDSDSLRDFIVQENLSILEELFEYIAQESHNNWSHLAHGGPEKFKATFRQWMDVFHNFSEEYKILTGLTEGKLSYKSIDVLYKELSSTGEREPMIYEAGVQSYGQHFLLGSMVLIGDTQPEEFRNMVYEIAQEAFEYEDPFTRNLVLYLIAGSMGHSEAGNISTLNTPIAKGLNEVDRLKGVDLRLALQALNFRPNVGSHSNHATKKQHKKYADIVHAALRFGVDLRDKDFEDKIYEISSQPYVEAIEAGRLPNSLYLKLKAQGLPKDA